jgi:hypothetical protein
MLLDPTLPLRKGGILFVFPARLRHLYDPTTTAALRHPQEAFDIVVIHLIEVKDITLFSHGANPET